MLCVRNECGWCLKREVTYLTEPLEGPVITVLSFLERSREPRRSFGAVCAGAVDVSIASGETTDNVVFVVGFVVTDGALNPTGLEVEGTSLVCVVPWLLPRFTGAFGGAVFKEGGAAEAAPPMGACGVCLGTLGVVQGIAENRSGADPPRTTSAYDVFPAKCGETRCRASRKLMFNLNFVLIISFSIFQATHDLEYAGWSPSQFAQWTCS